MNPSRPLCIALTTNLRCFGFTLGQYAALVIPPAIEVLLSLFFIYLYSGPARRAQVLLALDSTLYFTWALLDTLSHVLPGVRTSPSTFNALDSLVGAVSFTPILFYSVYLYRLSFRHLIPSFPRKLQPYLELLLPVLLAMGVAVNEVSSFVGTHLNMSPAMTFSQNGFLWLSLARSSLTIFTVIQFLFFLLAFSRLSRAFLDQRRIELAHSSHHLPFHGLSWVTTGIILGVIETISGFAEVSFGIVLARRVLRLISRATLMYGLLKGLDVAETFEHVAYELHGGSRIHRWISCLLCIGPRRAHVFHRMSQTHTEQSQLDGYSLEEKRPREQRVTVHYEKGQAPFLQIRFSTIDFPVQIQPAPELVQQRRLSGSHIGSKQFGASPETALAPQRPRVKSAPATGSGHFIVPDWVAPPVGNHARQGSGGTISDNLSVVRDIELKFPNLPPRVTGKYRGSILGQNFEEDLFPVVGVSRQSSMRQDAGRLDHNEGSTSVPLHSSNSIKRKPAPPLLDTHILDQHKRPTSTWGGLAQKPTNSPVDFPAAPSSPWEGSTVCGPDPPPSTEPTTPRSRRAAARNLIKRASRAVSDASVRSAEWLTSAMSSQSATTPLTAADIERYRRGDVGPRSARLTPSAGDNFPRDPSAEHVTSDTYAYAY